MIENLTDLIEKVREEIRELQEKLENCAKEINDTIQEIEKFQDNLKELKKMKEQYEIWNNHLSLKNSLLVEKSNLNCIKSISEQGKRIFNGNNCNAIRDLIDIKNNSIKKNIIEKENIYEELISFKQWIEEELDRLVEELTSMLSSK